MSTIVTRAVKGSPLTNQELDDNFTNLNNDKLEHIVTGVASASSIAIPANCTQYNVTALAENANFANPTGTSAAGQKFVIRIKDNGTPRTLSWNAIWVPVGVTLPTTTVTNKLLYVAAQYNDNLSQWDVIAVIQEA